jgi:hypothetical protein
MPPSGTPRFLLRLGTLAWDPDSWFGTFLLLDPWDLDPAGLGTLLVDPVTIYVIIINPYNKKYSSN